MLDCLLVFSTLPAHVFSPRKPGTTFPRILCLQGSPLDSTGEGNSQKIWERKRSRDHCLPRSHLLLLLPHFPHSSPLDLFGVSQTLQEYYAVRDFALERSFFLSLSSFWAFFYLDCSFLRYPHGSPHHLFQVFVQMSPTYWSLLWAPYSKLQNPSWHMLSPIPCISFTL